MTIENLGGKTILFPVRQLDPAVQFYSALLGVAPYVNNPYYAGFAVAGQDIGLDPKGHERGMTGPVVFWHVSDIRRMLRSLLDGGATLRQDVVDYGGGKLAASIADVDGNIVGLIQEP